MNDLSRGIRRDRLILTSAFEKVLDSGYLIMGPNHEALQHELGDFLGVAHVLGVASGTDALELAIKAVMPEGRNIVLTAANAGGYTTTAARRGGFAVEYVDVDQDTLCVSVASCGSSLTPKVGVLVVTHLYGNFTNIAALVELCHSRGIRVVEDCAQSIGARRDGVASGSVGDISATSFYPTKNLGALGDGGAVMTNNDQYAATASKLRQYGWSSKYKVSLSGGTNSRLDELHAAFLRARLPQLDSFNIRRRHIVARYAAAADQGPLNFLPAEGDHHAAHLAVARTTRREEIREALAEYGIQTDVHFPIPDHYQLGFGAPNSILPVTEKASAEVFSLPCFPELSDEEIDQVCFAIETIT